MKDNSLNIEDISKLIFACKFIWEFDWPFEVGVKFEEFILVWSIPQYKVYYNNVVHFTTYKITKGHGWNCSNVGIID